MQFIKYCMLFFVLILSYTIGRMMAQKYTLRLKELEELKNALNIFKSKIKFTYDPLLEIFEEISNRTSYNISKLFKNAKEAIKEKTAESAWEEAVEKYEGNLKKEDKDAIKSLSKLLGVTDIEGQLSQIEITESFLEKQIRQAEEEKEKNGKLYQKLGITAGLGIVIMLI